jgi:CelD/BcsL family acetyltransferase involved in cellulose biosynthesis
LFTNIDTTAMAPPKDILWSISPLGDRDALAAQWRDLEDRAEPSFFQTWSWIGTWLTTLPSDIEPILARGVGEGKTVALGILVPCHRRRYIFWKSRTCLLHETGKPELDSAFIEYNGWLAHRDHAATIPALALRHLGECSDLYDEIGLGGVGAEYLAAASPGQICLVSRSMPSFHLALQTPGIADLSRFGRNTRHQIRRALRDFSTLGPIEASAARDDLEALCFLHELKLLHQDYWTKRGRPGAFAAPHFEVFHRALIAAGWARGEIELLRVTAGSRVVGFLYNFLYRGRVYAYQSGFDYALLPRSHPGLLCHWLAIDRHRAAEAAIYDFMAGDNRLKRSLSSAQTELHWITVRNGSPRSRSYRFARWLTEKIRHRKSLQGDGLSA